MDVIASLSLVFDILARDKASSEFKKVGDAADKAGKSGERFGSSVSSGMKLAAGALAAAGIGTMLVGFVRDAAESAKIGRLTTQVIKSTGGAAHVTAQQVGDLATAISNKTGVDDEAIQSASNLLLTFTNVRNEVGKGNDIFNQATQTITDMSAALGQDTSASAIQLGKALNDPIKGITALSRVGVSFTEQQKEQIKTMVEAGDTLGAQKVILAELGKEFGGAAEAAADPIQKLTTIAGNLGEEIGTKALPAVNAFADFAGDTLIPVVGNLVGGISKAVGVFADLPGPLKLAAGAAVAWAIGGDKIMAAWKPVKGAFSGLRGTMSSFSDALHYAKDNGDGLTTVLRSAGSYAGGQIATGFKTLARAIGPELGIGLAIAGIGYLVTSFQDLTQASNDAKAAAQGLADALTLTDRAADMASVRSAIEDTDGLVEALERAGVSSQVAIDGLLGQAGAQDEVTRAFQNYVATHRDGQFASEDVQIVKEAIDNYNELAGGYGNAASSARFFGDEAGKAGGAADQAATPTSWLDKVIGRVGSISNEAADNVKDLRDELTKLRGGTVDAAEAQIGLYDAIRDAKSATDDLSGSVTTSNGKLNLQSEAGGAAYRALVDVADASNDVIDSMRTQGKSAEQMAKRDGELRVSFIKTAIQMGIGKKEAKKLADQILGVPKDRETKFKSNAPAVKGDVNDLQGAVDNLHGRTINITASVTSSLKSILGGFGLSWIGNARGNIIEAFANGGLKSMTGGLATVVPPNTWRVIGDRVKDDEAYIPINSSSRSRSILSETASRMGFGLMPMAAGGVNVVANFDDRQAAADIRHFNDRVKKLLEPGTGMVGALNWARTQVGKPYLWGSAGPTGYDCSGFIAALTNVIRGRDPYSRLGSTATMPWSGFRSGLFGSFQVGNSRNTGGGIGHMAGTLLGVNVESAGGVGVRVGGSARGARDGLFGEHYSMAYDRGGLLPPGLTLAYNGTGKHETIRTAEQERALGRAPEVHVYIGDRELTDIVDVRIVDAFDGATSRGRYNP